MVANVVMSTDPDIDELSLARGAHPAPHWGDRARGRKLRTLLIAEMCNPDMISVPLEGFSHSDRLRQLTDGHVVTHTRNAESLEKVGWRQGPRADFSTIDSERVARLTWDLAELIVGRGTGWTLKSAMYVPTYYYFEHLIWKQFGPRIKAGEFDLVHRVTPLSPTCPSKLATWCKQAGVPFVMGPLNGGVPWPKQFDAARRKEKEWLSYVRGAYRLLPGHRSTLRDSAAVMIGSRDTFKQVPRQYHERCFYVPEKAIDPARFYKRRQHTAARPIKVVFLGRLVPYKGADMLIEAVAPLAKAGALTLDILGDGPMMAELKALVEKLGVADAVRLPGWVKHDQVQERLAQSDVFAFPSVREFGGAVALEAMAVGCVPVVLDYGGPAELVTPQTGLLVPMGTRAQVIERFRAVLSDLAANPAHIEAKSRAAYRRAHEQFTWDAKARRCLDIYEWVLDKSRPKPQYAMPEPDLA